MNATIARIVDLAFASAAPTQEMRDLKEEVLANCQAHYEDLVAQGKTSDEATEAVVESLKGMEDLIRGSDARAEDGFGAAAFTKSPDEEGFEHIDASKIRHIRMELTSSDVDVAEDKLFSLDIAQGCRSRIETTMEGDTLVLRQVRQNADTEKAAPQGLLKWLQFSFMPFDECGVTMTLPAGFAPDAKITTRSGDITWSANAAALQLSTVSGDIEANLPDAARPSKVSLHTTNGDLNATGFAEAWDLHAINGDMEAQVSGDRFAASATNGDITLDGALRQVQLNTVSGDQDLTLTDPALAEITAKAVSGDIEISLSREVRAVALRAHTVSGKVNLSGVTNDPGAHCRVTMDSVSGDLSVGV